MVDKIEEKTTCIQCHKDLEFQYAMTMIPDALFWICCNSGCANYGLFTVPQEQMPKENKDNS